MVNFMKETVKNAENRLQRRAQKTRKRLKKAALDVFSEKSIDAATIEEITAKADVGKGTLYQHFTDKDEIAVTLVQEAVDHLIERVKCYETPPAGLDDMLEHLLAAHHDFWMKAKDEFLLLFQGRLLVKLEPERMVELEQHYLRYLSVIEEEVSRYITGRVDPVHVRHLACAVAGFVFGFFSFAMIGLEPEEMESSMKALRQSFVRSLSYSLVS